MLYSLPVKVVEGSPYKVVKGAITLDLELKVLEEAPARVRMLLNQPKVSRYKQKYMPYRIKHPFSETMPWSMDGTLQTVHSTSVLSLAILSL